jgi:hypothetical protein
VPWGWQRPVFRPVRRRRRGRLQRRSPAPLHRATSQNSPYN